MSGTVEDPFGLAGTRLDGKYDVLQVVAEGGFGVVYKGEHRALQKAVAIKVLKVPEEFSDKLRRQFLEKFALEARTIAKLEHPAIVRVLDFGACPMPHGEAAPWMVLDWVAGSTLEEDLDARHGRGGRTPAECLTLLRPVIEALAHAHDEGIAHRDIKPANIMLVRNKKGELSGRILDFGIAKIMGPEQGAASGRTATQTVLQAFSLAYAAPEQITKTRTGPWTDVHALGLVLTEMLTDEAAYLAQASEDLYLQVLAPDRPTPARRGVDVGAWETVLARAVTQKPAERYQDAAQFLEALLADVPVRAASRAVTGPASQAIGVARTALPSTDRFGVPDLDSDTGTATFSMTEEEPPTVVREAVTTLRGAERKPSTTSRGRRSYVWLAYLGIVVVVAGLSVGVLSFLKSGSGSSPGLTATVPQQTTLATSGQPQAAPILPGTVPSTVIPAADAGPPTGPAAVAPQGVATASPRPIRTRPVAPVQGQVRTNPASTTARRPRRPETPPSTPAPRTGANGAAILR